MKKVCNATVFLIAVMLVSSIMAYADFTQRVSISSDGGQGNDSSYWPSLSADGRFVAFESDASNLVSGDTNNMWDVFVHDWNGSRKVDT